MMNQSQTPDDADHGLDEILVSYLDGELDAAEARRSKKRWRQIRASGKSCNSWSAAGSCSMICRAPKSTSRSHVRRSR